MASPTIDERLLYPDSIPEIAENFNRVMNAIDQGGGGSSSDFHFVRFVPVFPEGVSISFRMEPQIVYHGDTIISDLEDIETPEVIALIDGVYTDEDMTEAFDVDSDAVTEDLTLYIDYVQQGAFMFTVMHEEMEETVCTFLHDLGDTLTAEELAEAKDAIEAGQEGATIDHFTVDGETVTEAEILALEAAAEPIAIVAVLGE